MKLAEALIERAELQRENAKLLSRIRDNAMVQEGDTPAENPEDLIPEYDKNMERLLVLTQRINETNSKTAFDDKMSLAEAIALRDCLGAKNRAYRDIYEQATIKPDRYSQKEVKFVRCIDVKGLQTHIDRFSKEYREVDTKLQGLNWTVDLV